jgi:hypothetical protein
MAEVVLAWVLAQPAVSAVVVGASWPNQARANAEAATLRLSADELFGIQRVFDHLELDPYAGLGTAARLGAECRRVALGARRRLTRGARAMPGLIRRAMPSRPTGGRMARFARTIP